MMSEEKNTPANGAGEASASPASHNSDLHADTQGGSAEHIEYPGPQYDDADDPTPQGPADIAPEEAEASEPEAPVDEVDELTELRNQLSEAEAKASEHWDQLLRLQAEMQNQRKRAQNDVDKARKFALEGIVNDLLPVKDSLEMGLAAAGQQDADSKALIEGAELTLKMLAQVFEKNNILEVNPVGEKFDPEFHQAMSMQEAVGHEPNTVTSVMQKGYTLNDRLVRPALVMVAK